MVMVTSRAVREWTQREADRARRRSRLLCPPMDEAELKAQYDRTVARHARVLHAYVQAHGPTYPGQLKNKLSGVRKADGHSNREQYGAAALVYAREHGWLVWAGGLYVLGPVFPE